MNNYEVIKKAKMIYQYIDDLLDNANLEMNSDIEIALKTTMSTMSDIYTNTHTIMSNDKEERNLLRTDLECPRCPCKVDISDLINYEYVCNSCDENYYSIEVNLEREWYKEDKNSLKLDKDLIKTINDNANDYLVKEINDEDIYFIKFWETDYDREDGISSQFLEKFKDIKQAVKTAKKLIKLHNYSCVEVINQKNNFAVFNKDEEGESYYNYHGYHNKIFKVSPKVLEEYVENWTEKKSNKCDYDLLYCENEDGSFTAVDDSEGQCWTEDFETESQAVFWLDTDVSVEDIPYCIIPKDIVEKIIDTTKNKGNEMII